MSIIPIKQGPGSLSKNRAEGIENVLTYLSLSEEMEEDWTWLEPHCEDRFVVEAIADFNKVPLTYFDGADMMFMYEAFMNEATTSYQRLFVSPFDPELYKLPLENWDCAQCGYFDNAAEILSDRVKTKAAYLLTLWRYRRVPLKDVRGLFQLRSSEVIESTYAHLFADGTYVSDREFIQYFGGAWHTVGIPMAVDPPHRHDDEMQPNPWLAKSYCLSREYDWAVHVGFNVKSIPTVSVITDPIESKKIFKLRDIPPGKSRRDALRHWVSGHHRSRPRDVEFDTYMSSYVWPYLRGAEEFTWNGLYCKIQPSAYDLRKAKEYQLMSAKSKAQKRTA